MPPERNYYQTITVPYLSEVAAGSKLTLASQRIGRPYRIDRISASFALNTNRTLRLYFFVSPDEALPTTKAPNGYNILGDAGQVDYLAGDDETKTMIVQAYAPISPTWVKVYADNTDVFPHTIDVLITLSYYGDLNG